MIRKLISIVIPMFNEELNVQEILARIISSVEKTKQDYEIILVDDGSSDSTWLKIKIENKSNNRIKAIKMLKNYGQHSAISAGIGKAVGDWVIVMDGDLQDRPEVIPELFQKAVEGNEIVFVSRQNRPEQKYYLILQKIYYRVLISLSGLDFDANHANYSIISRKVVRAFCEFESQITFYPGKVKRLGFKCAEIKANHGSRFAGKPSYSFSKRIKLAANIIITSSTRPLKLVIISSFIVAIITFTSSILALRNLMAEVLQDVVKMILLLILINGITLIILLSSLALYLSTHILEKGKNNLIIIDDTIL
jgi:glycosyltransferase involved in cell wall biosynthesis